MNNKKTVPVCKLEVSIYYKVTCAKHKVDLKCVSVLEAAYYKCLVADNNRVVFDEYVALARLKKPSWRPEDTFCNFVQLVESIRTCGFDSGKGDLTVWSGTNWLKDGHHRAAILSWIDPDYSVEVNELEENPPTDHNQCSNPCS